MTREEFAAMLRGLDRSEERERVDAIMEQIEALAVDLPPGLLVMETGKAGEVAKLLDELIAKLWAEELARSNPIPPSQWN